MIYVKYTKLTDGAKTPTRGSRAAAGFDLYTDCDKETVINPGETVMFHTGLAFEIPDGYFGAVYSRSGLGIKHNLRLPNCVGVIDADFRGDVAIPLTNDGKKAFTVMPHERIAQIVFQRCDETFLNEADELSITERGARGLGSSGRT